VALYIVVGAAARYTICSSLEVLSSGLLSLHEVSSLEVNLAEFSLDYVLELKTDEINKYYLIPRLSVAT